MDCSERTVLDDEAPKELVRTWKKIKDFPSYEISDDGQVRHIRLEEDYDGNITKKYKLLSFSKIQDKYMKVKLSKDGNPNNKYQHLLVAETFLPNPNNYKYIRHKDGNVFNNHYSNLEWYDKQKEMKRKKQIEKHKKEAQELLALVEDLKNEFT